ncbi:MAG: hypothetical protein JSV81_13050 [Anaerolineales bacterium]|nr:MAG: hypothetical protein JSV81_13050 [Anaerolineales bacterium]
MSGQQSFFASILALYTWGGVSVLLFFLFAIARFFERKSSRKSFYPLFILPILLFLGSALRYLFIGDFVGDLWGDLGRVMGGLLVGGLGYFLLTLMMGER